MTSIHFGQVSPLTKISASSYGIDRHLGDYTIRVEKKTDTFCARFEFNNGEKIDIDLVRASKPGVHDELVAKYIRVESLGKLFSSRDKEAADFADLVKDAQEVAKHIVKPITASENSGGSYNSGMHYGTSFSCRSSSHVTY